MIKIFLDAYGFKDTKLVLDRDDLNKDIHKTIDKILNEYFEHDYYYIGDNFQPNKEYKDFEDFFDIQGSTKRDISILESTTDFENKKNFLKGEIKKFF
jgi:hypothetical protein